MKSLFNLSWLGSKQPRKQRKFRLNAPLHIRRKMVSAHLSPELRKKYGRRSFPLCKGDKVKIVRGQYKGVINPVEKINLKKYTIFVKDAEHKKTEGKTAYYPISTSNVIILTLKLDDAKRKQALERNLAKNKKETKK
jgi:large subunit ribosomal protein L24